MKHMPIQIADGLQSEPVFCNLQTGRKLESHENKELRQFSDCGDPDCGTLCNLEINLSVSNGWDEIPDCGNSLPPSGGEEHAVSSPPTRRGLPGTDGWDRKPDTAILGLDLGTRTGWALLGRDGCITSGTEYFKPQRFEGGGMRYLRFKRWLTEVKQAAGDINAVYFEEVRRHVGVDAAHAYGGFMAHLTAWCEHHQIPYQGVPVGTIKKHATGKGNASKDEMIAAMQANGHPVTDDNEADALAILHWALETQEV